MGKFIDIIEKEVERKYSEQIARKSGYDNKALLAVTAHTLVLNVATNVYLSAENIAMRDFKTVLALAAIGVACVSCAVLVPKFEYDAPNIEKILDEYEDAKNEGKRCALRLREKIARAKAKAIFKNENHEKFKVFLMGASFLCLLLELIIMLIK